MANGHYEHIFGVVFFSVKIKFYFSFIFGNVYVNATKWIQIQIEISIDIFSLIKSGNLMHLFDEIKFSIENNAGIKYILMHRDTFNIIVHPGSRTYGDLPIWLMSACRLFADHIFTLPWIEIQILSNSKING